MSVGPDKGKKRLHFGKDLGHILDIKLSKVTFQYIFNDFGFLVDITPKLPDLHESFCMGRTQLKEKVMILWGEKPKAYSAQKTQMSKNTSLFEVCSLQMLSM